MRLVLLFMYVFSFKVISNISILRSDYISALVLLTLTIFNKKMRYEIKDIFLRKKVMLVFTYLIAIISYCLFISTFKGTYEYSIIKTFLSQFIQLFIGILLFSLYKSKGKEKTIVKDIIYIFIIQSCIQFISLISPRINEFFNLFRSDSAIIKGQLGYGGIRGLAISGSAFFGLGIGYGLIYIYYICNWNKILNKYKILKLIFFIMLLFGGLSAARSSIAGIIIGILYITIKKVITFNHKIKLTVKINKKAIILTSLLFLLGVITINSMKKNENVMKKFTVMNNFVFQAFHNKRDQGKFITSSTDALFNRMYFPLEEKTILFGDGYYTNTDGSYYMRTDAGYMRNLLYFGIPGFVLLLFYQFKFFHWRNNDDWLLNLAIIGYILIMHVKGDILGFGIMLQSMLFLVYLQDFYKSSNNN